MAAVPHPLAGLSLDETNVARDVIRECHPGVVLDFRMTFLLEPPKADVLKYLELEHAGKVTSETKRPHRLAQVRYDAIGGSNIPRYHESVVDLLLKKRVAHEEIPTEFHASLAM